MSVDSKILSPLFSVPVPLENEWICLNFVSEMYFCEKKWPAEILPLRNNNSTAHIAMHIQKN